jgi:hypothetical protein
MTFGGLGEMFVGDYADTCMGEYPLMLIFQESIILMVLIELLNLKFSQVVGKC